MYPPLQSLVICCKILGLWPYQNSRLDVVYRFPVLFMGISSVTFLIDYALLYKTRDMSVLYLTRMLYLIIIIYLQVTVFSMGFKNRDRMRDIVSELIRVDEAFPEMEVRPGRFHHVMFLLVMILHTPNMVLSSVNFNTYMFIVYNFSALQVTFIPVMLACLADVISTRFRSINKQLSQLQDLNVSVAPEVRKLVSIHDMLRGVIQKICSAIGLQLLIFFAFFVLSCSAGILMILQKILVYSELGSQEYLRIFSFIKYMLLIVVLASKAHSAATEGNKSVILVHGLHKRNTENCVLDQVENFSRGLIENYIRFSVGGILVIDKNLLVKIVINITTYLIITLQIEDVRKSETTTYLHKFLLNSSTNST